MELDLRDPEFRAIIVIILVVITVIACIIGGVKLIFGGGKDSWKNNFKVKWESDEQNNVTNIYIYNNTGNNVVIKPKFLQVEEITIKADGKEITLPVDDAPNLHPYADMFVTQPDFVMITLEGVYKKVKVTDIKFSFQLYGEEYASLRRQKEIGTPLCITVDLTPKQMDTLPFATVTQ